MNAETVISATAGWLLTVALHGSVFLAAAWLIDRTWRAPPNAWRELMWRVALFGGHAIPLHRLGGVVRFRVELPDRFLRGQVTLRGGFLIPRHRVACTLRHARARSVK